MEEVQRHFGAFDGRFLGVSLTVGSEHVHNLLTEPDTITRVTQDIFDRPGDWAIESICAMSAIVHETRHFHDHLLAPLGAVIMRARLEAYFHMFEFIAAVQRPRWGGGANCLPTPVARWCRKSDAERTQEVATWQAYAPGVEFRPPALPFISDEAELRGIAGGARGMTDASIRELVLRTAGAYETLRTAVTTPSATESTRVQPLHVHEASAMWVQLQDIWTRLGAEAASLFVNEVASDWRHPYALVFSTLYQLGESSGLGVQVASAVVTWAQLGDPRPGIAEASPVIRFARLLDHLQRAGVPDPYASPAELLEEWDAAVGSGSTADALRHSLEVDEAYLAKLEKLRPAHGEDALTDALDEVIAFYASFARARRHMVEAFLADPDRYITPHAYLEHADAWSRPPLKFVYSGDASLRVAGLAPDVWVQLSTESGDGERIAKVVGPTTSLPGVPHIDREAAFRFLSFFTLSDLLFAEFSRDVEDHEYDVAVQESRNALGGLRLVSVLD